MRTTYRAEISALSVRSSSFALPQREEAAFERFITGSVDEVTLVTSLRTAIAQESSPLIQPTRIEYLPPSGG
jgi:hypothetical protein